MQDLEYGEKTENVENEKCALYALEYWEKTEKRGKRDTHTVGLGIWRENQSVLSQLTGFLMSSQCLWIGCGNNSSF